MNDKPTAAEYFAEAEQLLARTGAADVRAANATTAQAHIAAARFLWDLQANRYGPAGGAADAAGLADLAKAREVR